MTTGKRLAFILLGFLFWFGCYDAYLWLTGQQTMSQWVILNSEQNIWIALGWLGFCGALIFGGIVLIKHWELPRIFKRFFKR